MAVPTIRIATAVDETISLLRALLDGAAMKEESFLRYRLEAVRLMPDGAYKAALAESIRTKMLALHAAGRPAR